MQQRFTFFTLLFSLVMLITQAQNTSPYWSLAGNSGTTATASSKLGTTEAIPLNLTTSNLTRLRINADGRVGIGTTNPQQRFHVEGPTLLNLFVSTSALGPISGSGQIGYTKHMPTASGQRLGYFLFGSRGGGESNLHGAGMVGYTQGAWSSTSWPAAIAFETTPEGSATRIERMRIDKDGNVGIGTTTPMYSLDVQGNALSPGTTGARLKASSGWVFLTLDKPNTSSRALLSFNVAGASRWSLGTMDNSSELFSLHNWHLDKSAMTVDINQNFIGIGNSAPAYPLAVAHPNADRIISALSTFSGNTDKTGLYSFSLNNPGWGYGVRAYGGYIGVLGEGQGTSGYYSYGLKGHASGNAGLGSRFGVYGTASGGNYVYGIYGSAGNGSTFNAAGYFDGNVYSNGILLTSDRKFKKSITSVKHSLAQIMRLKPSVYQFRTDDFKGMNLPTGEQLGLIADEVKEVFPQLVQRAVHPAEYDKEDRQKEVRPAVEYEAVNYQGLIPVLIASVQEQQKQITERDKKIEALELRLQKLEALLTSMTSSTSNPLSTLSSAYLEQNAPNPSRSNTIIRYGIPDGATSARLTLTNSKGQVLKTVNITSRGTGQLTLNTQALASGAYTYSLVVDGRIADTKQLLITR